MVPIEMRCQSRPLAIQNRDTTPWIGVARYPIAGEGARQCLLLIGIARHLPQASTPKYFEQIIAVLERTGVSIDFIIMPTSQTNTAHLHADNLERDFIDYLRQVAREHPAFHLSQSAVRRWLDQNFVDGVHLIPEGAAQFTALLNNCLRVTEADWQSGTYSRSCEFGSGP